MTRIENYFDRAVLRQKGWKLFGAVIVLQMLVIGIGYLSQI